MRTGAIAKSFAKGEGKGEGNLLPPLAKIFVLAPILTRLNIEKSTRNACYPGYSSSNTTDLSCDVRERPFPLFYNSAEYLPSSPGGPTGGGPGGGIGSKLIMGGGGGISARFGAFMGGGGGARVWGRLGCSCRGSPPGPWGWGPIRSISSDGLEKTTKTTKTTTRRQHELTKVLHEPATLRALTLLPVPSPPTPSFPLEWWIFVLLSIIIFITTTITPTRPPPPSLPPVLSTCRFLSTYDFHHHHSFPSPPSSPLLFYSSAELSHNLNNDFHHRRCKFSRRRPSEGGDGGGGCGGDENQQTLILQTSPRVSRTGLTSSPWPCESALSAAPAWPPAAPGATSLPWRPCAHPTWPSRVSSCLPRRSSDQSRSLRLRRYPFGARPGSWGCCRWPFLIAKSDQCQIFPTAQPEIWHHTVWRIWLHTLDSNYI